MKREQISSLAPDTAMLHPGYKQQFFLCALCASARKPYVKPPAPTGFPLVRKRQQLSDQT
jgi:hypothetical protein